MAPLPPGISFRDANLLDDASNMQAEAAEKLQGVLDGSRSRTGSARVQRISVSDIDWGGDPK